MVGEPVYCFEDTFILHLGDESETSQYAFCTVLSLEEVGIFYKTTSNLAIAIQGLRCGTINVYVILY